MSKRKGWFEVDRRGLAEIAKRRGMDFIITEPIQNAWDEDVREVRVNLVPVPGKAQARLVVEDDSPDGFRDLADSFMMFRSSYKLDNPQQRGRFNVGEKLLLAVAEEARIISTKGSVIFDSGGRRTGRKRTTAGTWLEATLRMTREELAKALALTAKLIPPAGIVTIINGQPLPERQCTVKVERSLDTEVRGEEGGFKYTRRLTAVRIYPTRDGEEPMLYEMGIPIDKLACPWHVEVMQKVPLSVDRGSVRYGYREEVERIAAEAMASLMDEEQSREGWVSHALGRIEDDDAVRTIVTKRFGKAVVFDPSAPESNKLALDAGFTVVKGGELPRSAWDAVRRAEALTPAGRLFPDGKVKTSPDGLPPVPYDEWTKEMKNAARYAEAFAAHVLGHERYGVVFYDGPQLGFAGACMPGRLAFNIGDPGVRAAVNNRDTLAFDQLLIHECAHEKVGDHLTHDFHRECCRIGAKARGFGRWL